MFHLVSLYVPTGQVTGGTHLAAPVPRACKTTINARARVEKVVGPRAVKGMPAKVRDDVHLALLQAPEAGINVFLQLRVPVHLGHFLLKHVCAHVFCMCMCVCVYVCMSERERERKREREREREREKERERER